MRLPEGWKILSLDNATKIIDCKHRTPIYVDKGVPLVSPGSIKWGAIDLKSTTKKVSFEEYQSLMDHCTVDIGDLILSRNQSIGVASYVDENVPFVLGQDTVLLKPTEIVSKFVFYSLQSTLIQKKIYELAGGSTFSRINLGEIKKLKIYCPPIPEQQKIAKILSTWDKAIEKLEALIAAKQKRKNALMQRLLTGKVRFAGFEEEWKKKTIKQMGKVVSGGTPDTHNGTYWNGNILWMTPTDVTALKNRFITNTKRKITEAGIKNSSATIVPKGSLLVCTRATIGLMSISTTDITTNQGFKNLIPNAKFDVDFLYYLFNFFKNELIRYACGSTFFELSKQDFEKIVFECPDFAEQQKLASVFSAADQELETHQNQLAALKQQKKALMQQLLTGKKRVKIDEVA